MKYSNDTKYNTTNSGLLDTIPGKQPSNRDQLPVKILSHPGNTAIGSSQALDEVVSRSKAIEIVCLSFEHRTTTQQYTTQQ
jgi:hypothetical protein